MSDKPFIGQFEAIEAAVLTAKLSGVAVLMELRKAKVEIAALKAERDRLKALVPHTKDGVRIIDNEMDVYHPDEDGPNSVVSDGGPHVIDVSYAIWPETDRQHLMTDCYSTWEAAQAAKDEVTE